MAEPLVLSGLKRKYAHTLGLQIVHEGDPERLACELAHLVAVILMFNPDQDFGTIKPIRPWSNRRGRAGRPWTVMALDVLRTANVPLTTREIARRVAIADGVSDPKTLYSIECSLHSTFARRVGVGVVRKPGSPKRWALGDT